MGSATSTARQRFSILEARITCMAPQLSEDGNGLMLITSQKHLMFDLGRSHITMSQTIRQTCESYSNCWTTLALANRISDVNDRPYTFIVVSISACRIKSFWTDGATPLPAIHSL